MNCFVCGESVGDDDFECWVMGSNVNNIHHKKCDPEVVFAKVTNVIAKPLNVKRYTAPSGVDYSVIDKNIIGKI